jgi:hypothetical protein
MSVRNLIENKWWPELEANVTAIYKLIIPKILEPRLFTSLWTSTVCYCDSFAFYLYESRKTWYHVTVAI